MKTETTETLAGVKSYVSACIQLGAFAHCLDFQAEELCWATHKSNKLEIFVGSYLSQLVKRNGTRTPEMGTASNSKDVFNWLTTRWIGWRDKPSIISIFYDPQMDAEKFHETQAIKNGQRTSQINILDLGNMDMAIQALATDGVNLDICIDGQIPQRVANDGPTQLLFHKNCDPEIVRQFEEARQFLNGRLPASQWFQFVVFALRFHKGESMQVPAKTLEAMKKQGSLLYLIAEAYEETLNTT